MVSHLLELYIVLLLSLGAPLNTLVDTDQGLPRWYNPGLHEEASSAFLEMAVAAQEDGVKMVIFSGYRSYEYQDEVYQREAVFRPDSVDLYLARPGHSEHQLGTAFDVAWPGLHVASRDPRNIQVFDWLEDHAHEYGFVLSYPLRTIAEWPYDNRIYPLRGQFIHEPWHIRYVGEELANEILSEGYLDPQSDVQPQDFYQVWP